MVAVIALIVFGPRRLPEIARSLGKSFAEFKRQASDIRAEFESGLDVDAAADDGADDGQRAPEDEKPAPTRAEHEQQMPAATSAEDERPA